MEDHLSIHQPLLVNLLGHWAGSITFSILSYLFALDWYRSRHDRSKVSAIASSLALVWNVGSLIAFSNIFQSNLSLILISLFSISSLMLLPAILLHISTDGQDAALAVCGYVLSGVAIAFNITDAVILNSHPYQAGLTLVTLGFSWLTLMNLASGFQRKYQRRSTSRMLGSICLFLLALSFTHLGSTNANHSWGEELFFHHAGIPLALFLLLYDYRFVFLDAFVRFAVNGALASGAVLLCLGVEQHFHLAQRMSDGPQAIVVILIAGSLLFSVFAQLRLIVQRILSRVVFRRPEAGSLTLALRELADQSDDRNDYLSITAKAIADFLMADVHLVLEPSAKDSHIRQAAIPSIAWGRSAGEAIQQPEAILPVTLPDGKLVHLQFGPRHGKRPYLSEDLSLLDQLGKVIEGQLRMKHQAELQGLVSQAELRALQAQINPHFFFNSLNTLYGTIARENSEARKLVLNLADVFRYFLRSERTFIRIEEELAIVKAYLEIEQLRLGNKLITEVFADEATLQTEIPVLSIQPLVENAVKHGRSDISQQRFVTVRIRKIAGSVGVEISNSGEFSHEKKSASTGAGVGLTNVRRRLDLCYGKEARLLVQCRNGATTVSFSIPDIGPIPITSEFSQVTV